MMQFQHLIEYRHLIRFCKEQQIPILPYSGHVEALTLRDIIALGIPDNSNRIFEPLRKEINRCLEFGYDYGILNKERNSKLKGDSTKDYWSSVSELKVGVWLEGQGIKILDVEPLSSDGGKGDYLVERRGSTVFIEVKTRFGDKNFLHQKRMLGDLDQYCREKQLPVESFLLQHYPSGYNYMSEKNSLLQDIEKSILGYLPISSKQTVTYEGASGVLMKIVIAPGVSHPVGRAHIWWSQSQESLQHILKGVQVADEHIPSICVFNDLNSNVDREEIKRSLYGCLVEDTTTTPKTMFREDNGIWSGKSVSGLNAVFVLRFEPNAMKVKTLDAYLCPNPKYELSKSIFSENNMSWWALDKSGMYIEALRN